MEPIEIVWRIFLAVSAIAIGSTSFRVRGDHSTLGVVLLYAVHIGSATVLALTAALGRLPW